MLHEAPPPIPCPAALVLHPHAAPLPQYQALIDRGWRRSGCYVYKPTVERTCCPQYTIRLPCLAFLPDKQQRRVLRKFARAVNALADGPDVQDGPKREGIGRRGGAVEIPAKDARGGGASGSGGGAVEVIDDGPIGPGDGRGDGTGDGGAEFLAEVLTRAVSGLVSSGVVAAEAAASARVKVSEPSAVARGRLGPAVAFCSPLPFALAKEVTSRVP